MNQVPFRRGKTSLVRVSSPASAATWRLALVGVASLITHRLFEPGSVIKPDAGCKAMQGYDGTG